jgi:hypothetical protein
MPRLLQATLSIPGDGEKLSYVLGIYLLVLCYILPLSFAVPCHFFVQIPQPRPCPPCLVELLSCSAS